MRFDSVHATTESAAPLREPWPYSSRLSRVLSTGGRCLCTGYGLSRLLEMGHDQRMKEFEHCSHRRSEHEARRCPRDAPARVAGAVNHVLPNAPSSNLIGSLCSPRGMQTQADSGRAHERHPSTHLHNAQRSSHGYVEAQSTHWSVAWSSCLRERLAGSHDRSVCTEKDVKLPG
ncbi:hypothetical protein OH77DRAFT_110440 [Trametes cingulata]|nr:hypothetical protein OH77DRAFT_110440 [Trametes cingulata]